MLALKKSRSVFLLTLVSAAIATALPAESATAQRTREIKWNNPDGAKARGIEHASFKSESMGVEVGYNVYLPDGYADGDERYGVIYFLHGAGGDENSDAGGFSGLVARAVAEKSMRPMICVFPNGGMSGYRDNPEGRVMVETMIVKELVPLVDGKYRTIAKRDGRVLAGFSMGGGGAVRLALKYPDQFSAAASWAGAFRRRGGETPELDAENLKKSVGRMRLLFIVGDEDGTLASFRPLREKLDEVKLPYTYKELEGVGHNLGKYYELTGQEFVRFLAPVEE